MRLSTFALVSLAAAFALASPACAAESGWHSETPVAAGIGVPAPLGEVDDIEFWAPNRGVMLTAGTRDGAVPAGVYAYDGTGWYLYATVCGGGSEGRGSIVWAGPDEFWTVSEYASKQEGNENLNVGPGQTLCHFKDGQVVASYAEPLGAPTTYQQMRASACNGPSNCWFAGKPLEGAANTGPFHLHWDGSSLTAVPSQTEPQPQVINPPGTVTGLAFLDHALFESADTSPYLREVNLGSPQVFSPVSLPEGAAGPFELGGDGGQLWAVALNGDSILRSIGTGFESVPAERPLGPVKAVAAEPATAGAWVGGAKFEGSGRFAATVTRVSATGEVSPTVTLPDPSEEISVKGGTARISCPAPGQCWLATEKGWLFHLGGSLPQDTDPAMHTLITVRPPDNSTRSFVPEGLPEDNSGETEPVKGGGEVPIEPELPPTRRRLVTGVHQQIVHKTILELTFMLHARAHVQLLARFHGKVVARTPRLTLGKGPHHLRLHLDPKRWPTALDFRVHAAAGRSS